MVRALGRTGSSGEGLSGEGRSGEGLSGEGRSGAGRSGSLAGSGSRSGPGMTGSSGGSSGRTSGDRPGTGISAGTSSRFFLLIPLFPARNIPRYGSAIYLKLAICINCFTSRTMIFLPLVTTIPCSLKSARMRTIFSLRVPTRFARSSRERLIYTGDSEAISGLYFSRSTISCNANR